MKRRKIIKGLSLLGVGGILAWMNKNSILTWLVRKYRHDPTPKVLKAPIADNFTCILTSPESEGPFYFNSPFRSDIREDRQGKELSLKLQIVRYPECTPIENAVVEIWHSDAQGAYSGYDETLGHNLWKMLELTDFGEKENIKPSNKNQYLRGAQKTDAEGMIYFTTIFPGWYDARVPHIHFKISVERQEELTSEFYFEEAFYQKVYSLEKVYLAYGACPYSFENDKAVQDGEGLVLQGVWQENKPIEVTAKIGIQKS